MDRDTRSVLDLNCSNNLNVLKIFIIEKTIVIKLLNPVIGVRNIFLIILSCVEINHTLPLLSDL